MKYKIMMFDENTGKWREVCSSENKGYLEEIVELLAKDGLNARVEES